MRKWKTHRSSTSVSAFPSAVCLASLARLGAAEKRDRLSVAPVCPSRALGVEDTVTGAWLALLEELGSGRAMWTLEPDFL